jgi:type I restriction enzyme S subunit
MEIREGYKQTEIGVIPEDWACEFIKDEYAIIDGDNIESGTLSDLNFYYITLENIDKGRLIGLIEIKYANAPSRARRKVKKGDVLIGTVRPNLMSHYYVREDVKNLVCSTGFSVVRAFPEKLCGEFIYHNLFAKIINKQIERILVGSSYPAINSKDIKNILFPLPPLPEQQAIATALSDIDGLINSLQKLIDKKKKIKQSAMQELLTGKRRLEGFSGEWVEVSLKDVAKFFKGKGLAKSDISNGGKYKCIHYGELFTVYKENIKSVISRTSINEGAFLSKENDVLMPTSDVTPNGLAKASCIQENNVILGGDILIIRSDDNIDGVFLSNVIRYNESQVLKLVSGITVYHLYASDMKNFYFRCPPTKAEQTAIANILSDMDSEIEALERKLNKYKDIKQGMMQELLTGRIRLLEEAVP